jgi:hypothetical protein
MIQFPNDEKNTIEWLTSNGYTNHPMATPITNKSWLRTPTDTSQKNHCSLYKAFA